MLKKTFTLILLLFLFSCGYEATHSKKNSVNYNFSITDLTFVGERDIKIKMKRCSMETGDKKEKNDTHFSYQEIPKMLKSGVSDVL